MTKQQFNYDEVSTALCLWEAMLEARQEPGPMAQWAELNGTAELRDVAIDLAPSVCSVWDSLSEDEQEELAPFDWNFAPGMLDHIQWDANPPALNVDVATTAAKAQAAGQEQVITP